MTVVPESTFVNFITLAESVALAPILDFCTSWEALSTFDAEELDLVRFARVVGLSELRSCS